MEWYSLVYRASYRLGFTPWDRGAPASGLVDLVEGPNALPRGRALDLGCGTGTNTIYLSKSGWDGTGIDMVASALDVARGNATRAGVHPRFIKGDVTHLLELTLEGPFDLLVDVGCFHTLPEDLRDRYAEGLSRVAAPGATLFLFAFSPGRLAPVRSGATADELIARFKAWDLATEKPSPDGASGRGWRAAAARYFGAHQYRLRRNAQPAAGGADA
jgi:SAM-dependent methyltransferase